MNKREREDLAVLALVLGVMAVYPLVLGGLYLAAS